MGEWKACEVCSRRAGTDVAPRAASIRSMAWAGPDRTQNPGPLTAARLGLALGIRNGRMHAFSARAIDLELERAGLALDDLAQLRQRRGVARLQRRSDRRIEDVDVPRTHPGAESAILATLEKYGFAWDGEVVRQSRRTAAYASALAGLAADLFGLPVSTTHVLSSGVAGTMAANRSGLQWTTVRNLMIAWVLTLPVSICLSGLLFWALRTIAP